MGALVLQHCRLLAIYRLQLYGIWRGLADQGRDYVAGSEFDPDGSSVTFVWSAGAGATAYWLDIGSSAGGNNYYSSGNLGNVLTVMVNGLPINGTTVNATLYSLINGSWQSNPYSYTAFSPVQGSPSPVSFLAAANYGADSQPY